MISSVQFDPTDFGAGEARPLSVDGEEPIRVEVRCFTFRPPPPDYRPCKACGVFVLSSGETRMITADRKAFSTHGGELHVRIRDAEGDVKEFKITVSAAHTEGGTPISGSA